MTATLATEPTTKATELTAPILTINSVNLVGRAGANPDVQYFESGTVKATISMAVRRRGKNTDPDWFSIELWNKNAETVANYIRKGDLFGISGYLKIESWIDSNTGGERSKPVIKANQVHLLGSKRSSSEDVDEEVDNAF